jgi:hypothetical protein
MLVLFMSIPHCQVIPEENCTREEGKNHLTTPRVLTATPLHTATDPITLLPPTHATEVKG